MWALPTDLITVFCLSAVVVFVAALFVMLLVLRLTRTKPAPLVQSQGPPCDLIYSPTTEKNTTESARPLIHSPTTDTAVGVAIPLIRCSATVIEHKSGDVAKPLLIGFEKIQEGVYPTRQLELLATEERRD